MSDNLVCDITDKLSISNHDTTFFQEIRICDVWCYIKKLWLFGELIAILTRWYKCLKFLQEIKVVLMFQGSGTWKINWKRQHFKIQCFPRSPWNLVELQYIAIKFEGLCFQPYLNSAEIIISVASFRPGSEQALLSLVRASPSGATAQDPQAPCGQNLVLVLKNSRKMVRTLFKFKFNACKKRNRVVGEIRGSCSISAGEWQENDNKWICCALPTRSLQEKDLGLEAQGKEKSKYLADFKVNHKI